MPIIASPSGLLNELWKNPIWTPLSVFVAVFIPVISGILYKYRQKRELSYILISDTSVVNVHKGFKEKVKVTYLGVPTKTLQLIRVKIINTGNQAIKKEDFDEPLTFVDLKPLKNDKVSGFFTLDIPEVNPKDLRPEVLSYNGRLGIKPLLLNPGDSVTVDILNIDTVDNVTKIDIRGRIVGVKKIKELKSNYLNRLTFTEVLIILTISAMAYSIISLIVLYFKFADLAFVLLLGLSIIIALASSFFMPGLVLKKEITR
jgi:hypothetical protein